MNLNVIIFDHQNEQAAMDNHDDRVTVLFNHLERLATPEEREEKVKLDPQQHLHRRLQHVERNLQKVADAVSSAADQPEVDHCLLEQLDEQVSGLKLEGVNVSCNIVSLDRDVSELTDYETSISQSILIHACR